MARAHDVICYDLDRHRMVPGLHVERGFEGHNDGPSMFWGDTTEMIKQGVELIFVAVPTPHEDRFEGVTPTPDETADFDYRYLAGVVWDIMGRINELEPDAPPGIVIMSTCAPGTIRREVMRITGDVPVVYNPSFIAMGSVLRDFWNAEFILIGGDQNGGHAAARRVAHFYGELFDANTKYSCPPIYRTGLEEAEMIKMAYNTFISLKICWANHLMELCHRANIDYGQVQRGLSYAWRRLWSDAYTVGGMGDGGHCHPRDLHVMRWLEDKHATSTDLFDTISHTRDAQAAWKVDLVYVEQLKMDKVPLMVDPEKLMPVVLMGTDYKLGYQSKVGSDALLVRHYLNDMGHQVYDIDEDGRFNEPCIFLLCLPKDKYTERDDWVTGDVVIDPWRVMPKTIPGVKVIRIGERRVNV
jgi:UDPglucose 6-dehydrogenase